MEIEFPIEFIVLGTPISSQGSAKSKKVWKETVKQASYEALPQGHFWFEGSAAITLFYFPAEDMQGDVDNIIKMTIDALVGHILKDDHQVERIVIQRFNPGGVFGFNSPSESLVEAIVTAESVLYVRISTDVFEELV